MKKSRHATYLEVGILVLVALVLTFSLEWVARQISPKVAPSTPLVGTNGSEVHTVNITDICYGSFRFENFNHVSGRFLRPLSAIENEEGSQISERGTYTFIISGLDIEDPDYAQKLQSLERLKKGDNLYHVTMYLPALFGSAVVYVNSIPVAQIGEIEDYRYINYSSNNTVLYRHTDSSEPMYLDIALDINQRTNSYNNLENCAVVTIHYESLRDYSRAFSGDAALIGTDKAVRGVVENNKLVLLLLSIVSFFSFVFAVFSFFLRDKEFFIPLAVSTAGFFGVGMTSFTLLTPTDIPYLLSSVQNLSYILIILGGCLSLPKKLGKLHVRLSLAIPFSVLAVLLAIVPWASNTFRAVTSFLWRQYFFVAIILIVTFIIYAIYKGETFRRLFSPTLVLFILAYRLFKFSAYAAILSPMFWISAIIMVYSSIHVFCQILIIERNNAYLTKNLKAEVARQTSALQRVVEERENALRFLSHDLRKPTRTIRLLLSTLIAREDDPEQIKTMKIVEQKLGQIETNLSDISRAFKESFVAEASDNVDIGALLGELYEALAPDCIANGIHLRYYPAKVSAYVKRQALKSVISNLIINAIEHANCNAIVLCAFRRGKSAVITVADNGVGMSESEQEQDLFDAYQSGGENDGTHGLGLYICRTYVESMHGTLSHEYTDGELVFTIQLPLA